MGKRKSAIWKYFEKNHDTQYATCLRCKKQYKTSGNTSNLHDHLKRYHNNRKQNENTESESSSDSEKTDKNKSASQNKNKQIQLSSYSSFIQKKGDVYSAHNEKKQKLDKLVVFMIAKDLQPFSVVADTGFRKLIYTLDPKYVLPNKTTIRTKILPSLYNEVVLKLKEMFNNVSFVSLTTDMWTSIAGEGYITITCHFIYQNELKSVVLQTTQMQGHHTAENIKQHIQVVIDEWKLNNKVQCIVTDNAQNMINACALLKIKHLPCFAHTLNLTVNDGINSSTDKNITLLLQKCKNIVKYFKKSTLAMDKLVEEQKKKNKKPLKPIQDVATRWNSVLHMIERLIELNMDDCLILALSKLPKAPDCITFNEFNILNEIIKLLKPFESATTQISADQYVTASLIIPLVVGIHTSLNEIELTISSDIAKKLCRLLKESVIKRLFPYECRTVPKVATLLDPRLKKYAFRNLENANQAQNIIQMEVAQIVNETQTQITECKSNVSEKSIRVPSSSGIMKFLTQRISQAHNTATATSESIITVRQYLEMATIDLNDNVMKYWKEFPNKILLNIAEKYNCVPATSVPSERIFSKAGQIISSRRANLKPQNVDKLIFINQNSWLLKD